MQTLKVGFVSVSEILVIIHKYAYSKGVKTYTTSKKTKLYSSLLQFKFPKVTKNKKLYSI